MRCRTESGGGLAHGQAIGSTDRTASEIRTGRVTPSDLGATVFRHLGIDPDAHWTDPQGRPHPIVTEGGRPIPENQAKHIKLVREDEKPKYVVWNLTNMPVC